MAIEQLSLMRVFDKMSEGVLVLDPDWRILYANDSSRRYLGLSATDETISEDLRPKLLRNFILSTDLMTMETDEEHSIDFEAANPEDRSYDMTLSLYMSRATDDGTRILLIRDITDEQHEKELKQDFLSFISHKLRTPISTLKISLTNLRDGVLGSLNEHQVESLDMSQRKVKTLEKVIDRLITFTTLRDERLKAERSCIDAQTLVRNLSESFARKPHDKRLKLAFNLTAEDALVDFRETLFKTMLESILDNSIKFANEPQVSVVISCSRSSSTGDLLLEITDDGPGIPPTVQQDAFQPFTQRDDEFTGNTSGLGLGLATVRYLMKLYGGKTMLESSPGRGTTIKLLFPPRREDSSSECSG